MWQPVTTRYKTSVWWEPLRNLSLFCPMDSEEIRPEQMFSRGPTWCHWSDPTQRTHADEGLWPPWTCTAKRSVVWWEPTRGHHLVWYSSCHRYPWSSVAWNLAQSVKTLRLLVLVQQIRLCPPVFPGYSCPSYSSLRRILMSDLLVSRQLVQYLVCVNLPFVSLTPTVMFGWNSWFCFWFCFRLGLTYELVCVSTWD